MNDKQQIEQMLETFKSSTKDISKKRVNEFVSLCQKAILGNNITTRDMRNYMSKLRLLPNIHRNHLPRDPLAKIRDVYSTMRYVKQEKNRNLLTVYVSGKSAHGKSFTLRNLGKRLNKLPGAPTNIMGGYGKTDRHESINRAQAQFTDIVYFDHVTTGYFMNISLFNQIFDPNIRYGYTYNSKRYHFTPDYAFIADLPTVGSFIARVVASDNACKHLVASKPQEEIVFHETARDELIEVAKRLPVHIRTVCEDYQTGKSVYIVERFNEDVARSHTGTITADSIQSWYDHVGKLNYTHPTVQDETLDYLVLFLKRWRDAMIETE